MSVPSQDPQEDRGQDQQGGQQWRRWRAEAAAAAPGAAAQDPRSGQEAPAAATPAKGN